MIRGFMKTTLADYPGKVASSVFLGGCNLRCPYCHNADIVLNRSPKIDVKDIISHFEKRKGVIEAVCISGGEPTIWENLPDLINKFKSILIFKLCIN